MKNRNVVRADKKLAAEERAALRKKTKAAKLLHQSLLTRVSNDLKHHFRHIKILPPTEGSFEIHIKLLESANQLAQDALDFVIETLDHAINHVIRGVKTVIAHYEPSRRVVTVT